MTRFIVRRLLQMIPLLIGITFLTFAIVNLIPGSPVATLHFNPRMRPQDIAHLQASLGLDKPWPERYVQWLSHLVRGDLGISLANFTPVTDRILGVLPNTLLLAGSALLFALVVSIPLGVYSAVKRNSLIDHLTTIGSTGAFAIPTFWLGLMLIILFSVKFHEWGLPSLPASGMKNFRGSSGPLDRFEHLLLPMISLGIVQLAAWTRYIRSSMLEVIRQDFVRTAQAKGLRERTVLYSHAFRNALLPLVTLIGLSLPDLFGGAIFIEVIFAWNGIGRLTYNAAISNDYTVIMGAVLLFAVMTLIGNLIADVAYAALDPRIKFD